MKTGWLRNATLPSRSSRDYGKPFAEEFAHYEHDFFRIDPMLFSPARVAVTAVDSGRTFFAGALDGELLQRATRSASGRRRRSSCRSCSP